MTLGEYNNKRRFTRTPEPQGSAGDTGLRRFVVQKHMARNLHYDLRLEMDGVLKSWAVPKGPSFDTRSKRMAVQVEDHPLEYLDFEGVIPKGEYGAGSIIVWDRGIWRPIKDEAPQDSLLHGELKLTLHGEKLRGGWVLVRMKEQRHWLLIKERDAEARIDFDVLSKSPNSVLSGRPVEQVSAAKMQSLELQLAAPAADTPQGSQWLHEIKFDGYRMVCRVENGEVGLLTRNGLDWTERFPELAMAAQALPVKEAILDGELVALLPNGVSSFSELQSCIGTGQTGKLIYYAFDLLHLDGESLCDLPLERRKQRLQALLADSRIQYVDHIEGNGPAFFSECCRIGLEGVISKRRDRPYRKGRHWVKTKCIRREEFVVGGYTLSSTNRKRLGALLVGYYDKGKLTYAGKVGSGFGEATLAQLQERLESLRQPDSPFLGTTPGKGVRWCRPELVAQVEFSNWTGGNLLRHPVYQGLREDLAPSSVGRETPEKQAASKHRRASFTEDQLSQLSDISLTHPDRVLYSGQGITKLALATYYAEISEWMLPHLVGRPLTVVRSPKGTSQFYQRHVRASTPKVLHGVKDKSLLAVQDLKGLVSLVQLGVLEIHPWGAREDKLDRPDRIILDLDPDPILPWVKVVDAAIEIRERLEFLGLQSVVKTSGSKGLHIVVPIQRRHTWDEVKRFTKDFATRMANTDRFTATLSKAAREGRIFIDYHRNSRGATAIAAYSTRALPGAPVSLPLFWHELSGAIRPDHFHIATVPTRLAALDEDPWGWVSQIRQSLSAKVLNKLKNM